MSKATHFEIQKSSDNTNWITITVVPSSVSSYVVTGGILGVNQYYRIRAVILGVVQTNLPMFSGFTSSQSINIPEAGNEALFVLERKKGSGSYAQIANISKDVFNYLDYALSDGNYTYRVKASNAIGDSGYSNEAIISIETNRPQILWTIPFDKTTNVPITLTKVKARFDRTNMDASTITSSTFLVNDGVNNLIPAYAIYFDKKTGDAIFPLSPIDSTKYLMFPGNYTITLKSTIADLTGESLGNDNIFTFKTTNKYISPRINWTTPMDGQTSVNLNVISVQVRFDRYYMDALTFTDDTFVIKKFNGNKIKADSISFDYTFGIASFIFQTNPSGNSLDSLETYSVSLSKKILDMFGVSMDFEYDFKFTTGSFFPSVTNIDLLSLFPEKYRSSPIIQDLVSVMNDRWNYYSEKIKELKYNQDPWTAPDKYLPNLADFVGLELMGIDDFSSEILRKQVLNAIEWFKIKGTYQGMKVLLYWMGFDGHLVDLYVSFDPSIPGDDRAKYNILSDYIRIWDWFVGDERQPNPIGLDNPNLTYFKTPHYGVVIRLIKLYIEGSPTFFGEGNFGDGTFGEHLYLWSQKKSDILTFYVNKSTPINTVPHYILLLSPEATDDMVATEYPIGTNIWTRVYSNWNVQTLRFDMQNAWEFDNGKNFDTSFINFIKSFNRWELGDGNKGVVPDFDFAIANKKIDGGIAGFTIFPTLLNGDNFFGVRIDAEVPAVNLLNLSEFAIYSNYDTEVKKLEIASTFPDISLDVGVKLIISTFISF